MTEGGPLPEPDEGDGRGPLPRWTWVAAGIGVVLLVVAGVVLATDGGDDAATAGTRRSTVTAPPGSSTTVSPPGSSPDGTSGASTTPGVDATSTTQVEPATPAPPDGDPASGPMASIPVGSIPPGSLSAVCDATVARLQIYRTVAAANGAPLAGDLFTSMTEFEADITTNAKNEEWGDFLVEKLTGVRREWSNARSTYDSGDAATAAAHADAALAQLDAAIGGVSCT